MINIEEFLVILINDRYISGGMLMIQRLNNTHHKKVIKYLHKEKEVNIFLLSDIERYGYDSYFFSIYGGINENGEIEGILLKCFEFIIFYAYDKFNVDEFAQFINESNCEEVCGKSQVLEKLEKQIDLQRYRKVTIFKLSNNNLLPPYKEDSIRLRKIRFGNLHKIVKLYEEIDEFENTTIDNIKSSLKTGRGYCIEREGKVVSMVKTTSENRNNAMIIGVGTHPKYRNRNYATKCLIKICNELLDENKIPCLFCDNEAASSIYKMLGFEEIGYWSIYRK